MNRLAWILLLTCLIAAVSAYATPATTGSYTVSLDPSSATLTLDEFDDNGVFVYQTVDSSYFGPLSSQPATPSVYVDSTAFANALNVFVPGTTITQENFKTSTDMTVTDQFVSPATCALAPCGAPPNPDPLTISSDGSSVTGQVADCGGPPHCTVNGWSYGYQVHIHFNEPVYGVYAAIAGWPVMLSAEQFDDSLPSPGAWAGDSIPEPQTVGWIFTWGIQDLTIDAYNCDTNGCGVDGTIPFTLSNLEIATGGSPVPEPHSLGLLLIAFATAGALFVRRISRCPGRLVCPGTRFLDK